MPRRKKELKQKLTTDPHSDASLPYSEVGRQRLLDVAAFFYQSILEEAADELPDGQEKQELLEIARVFGVPRTPDELVDQLDHELNPRQWEAEAKEREKKRRQECRFLSEELNRMASLSEPIFVLDLPDELLQKLVAMRFDTVGKVPFGVQVATRRAALSSSEQDFDTAVAYSRNRLVRAVGQEGYNLLGSRLVKYGYLQRDRFLSELDNETE